MQSIFFNGLYFFADLNIGPLPKDNCETHLTFWIYKIHRRPYLVDHQLTPHYSWKFATSKMIIIILLLAFVNHWDRKTTIANFPQRIKIPKKLQTHATKTYISLSRTLDYELGQC